jgi:hypothetical protein
MLTLGVKRGTVAALAGMLLMLGAFTGGTAMVQVQAQAQPLDGGTTLTPGEGASPQEELLAEALGAMVQAGFNPADFDFENAVFDPQGRAVLLLIKSEHLQLDQLPVLVGLLYTRGKFVLKNQILQPGLHPIHITQLSFRPRKGSEPPSMRPLLPIPILPPEGWILCSITYTVGLGPTSVSYTYTNPACLGNQGNGEGPTDGGDGDSNNEDDADEGDGVINDNATLACLLDPSLPECQ